MSDLISRSALIEEMKKAEIEYENAMMCPSWWSAFNIIREQPTAYSVDKVVEELMNHKDTTDLTTVDEEMILGFTIYQGAFNEAIDRAIEIVKHGDTGKEI